MNGRVAPLLVPASLLLGGCVAEAVECAQIAAAVAGCDVRPENLTCEDLSPSEQAALYERVDELGCEGVWNDERTAVDDRACRAFAWDCPSPFGPEPAMTPTRYPVVFVGGIDGREEFDWHPDLLAAIGDQTGVEVHHVSLPAWLPTRARALDLLEQIDEVPTRASKFNLVCYAVGGIDCRYLVSPGGLFADDPEAAEQIADHVVSVTTIATPHRGTAVANAALSFAEYGGTAGVLASVLGPDGYEATAQDEETVREALRGLTNEQMLAFNRGVVDADDVFYQSYAAVSVPTGQPFALSQGSVERHCVTEGGSDLMLGHADTEDVMHELLWVTAAFAGRTVTESGASVQSPIDGMVSVDSAKWGKFRGCLPADHYDVIGQFDDFGPDPRTGFDAARFYAGLVNDLAERGL